LPNIVATVAWTSTKHTKGIPNSFQMVTKITQNPSLGGPKGRSKSVPEAGSLILHKKAAKGSQKGTKREPRILKNRIKSRKNRPWDQHLEKSTKKCWQRLPKPDKVWFGLESECNPAHSPNPDKVTKRTSQSTSKWSAKRAKTVPGANKNTLKSTREKETRKEFEINLS
jgi:hypothetical protein